MACTDFDEPYARSHFIIQLIQIENRMFEFVTDSFKYTRKKNKKSLNWVQSTTEKHEKNWTSVEIKEN